MAHAFRKSLIAATTVLLPAAALVGVSGGANAAAAGAFPAQFAAPYLQIASGDAADLAADMKASGNKYYTLAFLTPKSGCTLEWEDGGNAVGAFSSQISSLQSSGGNVMISFGGEAGGEVAQTCTNATSLESTYANAVSANGVNRLDFDIEGSVLDDTASNARRDTALAALQKANPSVQIDFTIPVDPTGLESNALALLKDAKSKGVNVSAVNIMTMDFGNGQNAFNDAESAANATEGQLATLYGGSAAANWARLGLTPIAGKNDDNENFTQANAKSLETFAASKGVQELAFWEVDQYDKPLGYAYSSIFTKITGGSTAPSNDFSVSDSPASGSVVAGSSTTSTVSTAVTSGAAQSVALTTSGAPAGVTVSLSPASVTAGASSTLTASTTSSAAAGTYPITVTGTAASGAHTAMYTLTVTTKPATNDFSVSLSPASDSVLAGGSTTSTVSTAVVSGTAQAVALTTSGAPSGVSVSLSPASVTAGGSSTLTATTTSAAAAGTYPITVTGTSSSASHSATYTLTVTTSGGGGPVTYQAESSANTLTGTASVITCAACSGGARVGNIGAGAGTLTINNITVPTAGTYQVVVTATQDQGRTLTAYTSVNGGATTKTVFNRTASWSTDENMTVPMVLNAGSNTITFSNPTKNCPDIDAITVPASGS